MSSNKSAKPKAIIWCLEGLPCEKYLTVKNDKIDIVIPITKIIWFTRFPSANTSDNNSVIPTSIRNSPPERLIGYLFNNALLEVTVGFIFSTKLLFYQVIPQLPCKTNPFGFSYFKIYTVLSFLSNNRIPLPMKIDEMGIKNSTKSCYKKLLHRDYSNIIFIGNITQKYKNQYL